MEVEEEEVEEEEEDFSEEAGDGEPPDEVGGDGADGEQDPGFDRAFACTVDGGRTDSLDTMLLDCGIHGGGTSPRTTTLKVWCILAMECLLLPLAHGDISLPRRIMAMVVILPWC